MQDPEHTLEITENETLLFSSRAGWLKPLYELEQWLHNSGYRLEDLAVEDKVVGRAAALLLCRLGLRRLRTAVLSRRAVPVLAAAGVRYHAELEVAEIGCETEQVLADCDDHEAAYREIMRRLGK